MEIIQKYVGKEKQKEELKKSMVKYVVKYSNKESFTARQVHYMNQFKQSINEIFSTHRVIDYYCEPLPEKGSIEMIIIIKSLVINIHGGQITFTDFNKIEIFSPSDVVKSGSQTFK